MGAGRDFITNPVVLMEPCGQRVYYVRDTHSHIFPVAGLKCSVPNKNIHSRFLVYSALIIHGHDKVPATNHPPQELSLCFLLIFDKPTEAPENVFDQSSSFFFQLQQLHLLNSISHVCRI